MTDKLIRSREYWIRASAKEVAQKRSRINIETILSDAINDINVLYKLLEQRDDAPRINANDEAT